MIYLDSSPLVKLLFQEPQSEALASWLLAGGDLPKLASSVSVVEVVRVCRRVDPNVEPAARSLLRGLDLVPISQALLESATQVGGASLRSLDALQLATARTVREDLDCVVACDRRLLQAAEAEGLPAASPA